MKMQVAETTTEGGVTVQAGFEEGALVKLVLVANETRLPLRGYPAGVDKVIGRLKKVVVDMKEEG
jgi:hypothetical protein